jgi:hypothetical protein
LRGERVARELRGVVGIEAGGGELGVDGGVAQVGELLDGGGVLGVRLVGDARDRLAGRGSLPDRRARKACRGYLTSLRSAAFSRSGTAVWSESSG